MEEGHKSKSKGMIRKKDTDKNEQSNHTNDEGNSNSVKEPEKLMAKKKNLEIEVIEHPEADEEAEEIGSESGSNYEETDPNQYSDQVEPNHRKGTEDDQHKLSDSMEGPGGAQYHQSFGNQPSNEDSEEQVEEGHKIKQNASIADNKSKIDNNLLNDFVKKKGNDRFNQTTKLRDDQDAPDNTEEDEQQYSEEVLEDDKIDDDLVERQQREAEELLEETKKTMNEDDQDQSLEEEEDENEEIAKMARENRINEMNPEEEEEEDENEQADATVGKKFELNYTVGRIEDGAAILISKDHNLIEIPL
jgi:hypothetical protein